MVCSRCGHDNPSENRYCGMCGTRTAEPAAARREPVSAAVTPARSERASSSSVLGLGSGPSSRADREYSEPGASITGPSFLGLGDSEAGSSYLLDDEEASRSHAGLWVFLVLLLAAVLFGLQFRDQVRRRGGEIYAAVMARVNGESAPATASPAAPVNAPSSQPENLLTVSPSDAAKNAQPASPDGSDSKPDSKASEIKTAKAADVDESLSKDKSGSALAKSEPVTADEVRPARKKAQIARQRTASVAPPDNRMLRLAQQYLHGQGVPRNCDQGMVYLRESLKRPTAAAASQMGALYATGTCVPQDRVSAYRWFNSALQLDPNNSFLVRERDEIYAQMSSTERRQIQ